MEAFADADMSNKNIDTKQKYRDNIDTTFVSICISSYYMCFCLRVCVCDCVCVCVCVRARPRACTSLLERESACVSPQVKVIMCA